MKITREMAYRVLSVVDRGLVSGLGDPVPGKMCVEAAVCYALGQEHGDDPECVDRAVSQFKVSLNDEIWPSNKARATGLRKLAIAQLGTRYWRRVDNFDKCLAQEALARVGSMILKRIATSRSPTARSNAASDLAALCESFKDGDIENYDEFCRIVRDSGIKDSLKVLADIGLKALIAIESPGVKFLGLCDVKR